jgi:hypothetical protein
MSVLWASVVVVVFAGTIEYLKLPDCAREVGRRGLDCLDVLRDASLNDREKETALQRHAKRLFVLLGRLAGGSGLALGGPLLVVWGLDRTGLASFSNTLVVLQRLDFLAGTVVVGLAGYLLVRRFRTP